jgi:HSP20 family protein
MRNALVPRFGFGDLWHDFGREFDEMFSSIFADAPRDAWLPASETRVEDGKLHLQMDLPGVDPKEVEILLEGSELVIRGERKSSTEGKGGYRETRYGSFERRFTVPKGVDAEKVEAKYDKGVLALTMPLPEATKAKRINVATPAAPALEASKDASKAA